jgi:phage protein D
MAVPIYQRSAEGYETFYAPAFAVKLASGRLPGDVVHDVMQVTYRDSIDKLDSFELTINNWDASTRSCKYIGNGAKDEYEKLFLPGEELQLYMGYRQPSGGSSPQQLTYMMKGQITALDADFPNAGGPILRVRGLNILHRFQKKQYSYIWENMRDSEIAKQLSNKASGTKPGLGIEVRVDENALAKEPIQPIVFMHNMHEILFLFLRARRHGYTLYLVEEKDGSPVTPYLYFGPSDSGTGTIYKLEWGKSLLNFHPTLNLTRQVAQVTVKGWNRQTQGLVESTATWGDAGVRLNLDLKSFLPAQALTERSETLFSPPFDTQEQVKAAARDLLLRHLKEMLPAQGSTVGLPELRAGRIVQIGGLGKRFDGNYFLTETTHTIGSDGYRTTFNARREQE